MKNDDIRRSGPRLPPPALRHLEQERRQLAEWRRAHPGQTPDPADWEFPGELGLFTGGADDEDDMPPSRATRGWVTRRRANPPPLVSEHNADEPARRPLRSYRRQWTPEDYDDDPEEELLQRLERIDYQREQVELQRQSLQSLLEFYPELAGRWKEFTSLGGVSASDFRKYLDGQWRPRITRQRKHLRLIVNRRQKPVTIRGLAKDSDPAA